MGKQPTSKPGMHYWQPIRVHKSSFLSQLPARLFCRKQCTLFRFKCSIFSLTYWLLGKRIVEQEQQGKERAGYGTRLLQQLSQDLVKRFGRGFSIARLEDARLFYLMYAERQIPQTVSGESQTYRTKREAGLTLSWSHYVLLLRRTKSESTRAFYEAEALRGGWSVRQLERQIDSQFYERALLSKTRQAC